MSSSSQMRPSRCARLLVLSVALLALVLPALLVVGDGAWVGHEFDSDSEASVVAGLDQAILDSAAAEIQAQADLEAEANANYHGHATPALEAGSAEAAAFEASGVDLPEKKPSAFAFLSEMESPVSELSGVDVESNLDTIATELDSLFKSESQQKAEAAAKAQAEAATHTAQGRAQARKQLRIQARKAQAAQAQAQAAAAKKAAAPTAASTHVAPKAPAAAASSSSKLARRLDGYRTARGHKEEISTLEATAQAHGTQANGYSMPSAYAPAVVGAIAPNVAFQGQVAVSPAWNQWAALGLQAPAPIQPVAPAASTTNLAGVDALLKALKQVQEQQETQRMLSKLSALLSSQSNAAALQPQVAPAVVSSPFNYGQQLYATPQGYVNPNLLPNPTLQPRLLPGALPNMSPAYPSYIPANAGSVGVADEQPNPFEAHAP